MSAATKSKGGPSLEPLYTGEKKRLVLRHFRNRKRSIPFEGHLQVRKLKNNNLFQELPEERVRGTSIMCHILAAAVLLALSYARLRFARSPCMIISVGASRMLVSAVGNPS